MSAFQPFAPKFGSNQVLTAGASALTASLDTKPKQIRVVNTGGTNKGYVRTYNSKNFSPNQINGVTLPAAPAATVADLVIGPNQATTFSKGLDDDTISYISASGTTLEVIQGEGW